jgi:hypothetical protein
LLKVALNNKKQSNQSYSENVPDTFLYFVVFSENC